MVSSQGAALANTNPPNRRKHRRILRHSSWMFDVGQRPTLKRLARRGGVKRMSGFIYEESRGVLYQYLRDIFQTTILHTVHDYRKTVTSKDVAHGLRQMGTRIYGLEA